MQMKTRIPEGLTQISEMMGMLKEEVRAWPYYKQMRSLIKDYNLGAISKDFLVEQLYKISLQCADDAIYHYSTGVEKAIAIIKACY